MASVGLGAKFSAVFCIIALFGLAGCDKGQTSATSTPNSSTPAAETPANVATANAMTELAGVYNAVSDVTADSPFRRHQALTLKTDGTAELDTMVKDSSKPSALPKSSDQATGTYTAGAHEVVATFTLKDGKAIPASDDKHTLKLTRGKGDKSLTGEDGRTFEKAK